MTTEIKAGAIFDDQIPQPRRTPLELEKDDLVEYVGLIARLKGRRGTVIGPRVHGGVLVQFDKLKVDCSPANLILITPPRADQAGPERPSPGIKG